MDWLRKRRIAGGGGITARDLDWLSRRAARGDPQTVTAVGLVLHRQGAAESRGLALFNLGVRMAARGDSRGAGRWLRRAAEGHPGAMFCLGLEANFRREWDEAKSWYRRAAALAATSRP